MGTTPKSNVWGFAGFMLLALLLMSFSPAYGGTISETFTNDHYDTNLWDLSTTGQGTTATIANNELEVTVAGDGYGNLFGYGFTLSGDFTMTVDFTLINWPADNGTQLSIGTNTGSSSPFQVARGNSGQNGVERYFTLILGQWTGTNGITGPPSIGKLRMARTGNTMVGSYYDGSNWITIGSDTKPGLGGAVQVGLGVGPYGDNYSGIPAEAAFDNIQITYNTGNTGHLNPGLMLLLM